MQMEMLDTKTKLSALWLFILLNIIFRDLHQFARKGFIEMLLTGTYNGVEVTEELMLLGGFLAEVPIAMVLFSLLLTRRIGRPVTFVAAFITTATLLSSAPSDMDDAFHLIIELAAMVAILWTAWTWPDLAVAGRSLGEARSMSQQRVAVLSVLALVAGLAAALLPARAATAAAEIVSYALVQPDASLKVSGKLIYLYGLYIPPSGKNCQRGFNPPLCGNRAAVALDSKIQGFVACRPVLRNHDRSIDAFCRTRLAGEDLGGYLISQGWALALPSAPFQYHALERIARRRGLGVWGFQADSVVFPNRRR